MCHGWAGIKMNGIAAKEASQSIHGGILNVIAY